MTASSLQSGLWTSVIQSSGRHRPPRRRASWRKSSAVSVTVSAWLTLRRTAVGSDTVLEGRRPRNSGPTTSFTSVTFRVSWLQAPVLMAATVRPHRAGYPRTTWLAEATMLEVTAFAARGESNPGCVRGFHRLGLLGRTSISPRSVRIKRSSPAGGAWSSIQRALQLAGAGDHTQRVRRVLQLAPDLLTGLCDQAGSSVETDRSAVSARYWPGVVPNSRLKACERAYGVP